MCSGSIAFSRESGTGGQAASHSDYLRSLALMAADDEAAEEKRETARLKLLAHVYAVRVTHLTTGMRIGQCHTSACVL